MYRNKHFSINTTTKILYNIIDAKYVTRICRSLFIDFETTFNYFRVSGLILLKKNPYNYY